MTDRETVVVPVHPPHEYWLKKAKLSDTAITSDNCLDGAAITKLKPLLDRVLKQRLCKQFEIQWKRDDGEWYGNELWRLT